jgi:hypothetical protein
MSIGAVIAASCGWRVSPPPLPAVAAGRVDAVSVDVGLSEALRTALDVQIARAGAEGGIPLYLAVRDLTHEPEVATPERGLAVLQSTLRLAWTAGSCAGEVASTRRWTLPAGAASDVAPERASVVELLAVDAVQRALDALALRGVDACR